VERNIEQPRQQPAARAPIGASQPVRGGGAHQHIAITGSRADGHCARILGDGPGRRAFHLGRQKQSGRQRFKRKKERGHSA